MQPTKNINAKKKQSMHTVSLNHPFLVGQVILEKPGTEHLDKGHVGLRIIDLKGQARRCDAPPDLH